MEKPVALLGVVAVALLVGGVLGWLLGRTLARAANAEERAQLAAALESARLVAAERLAAAQQGREELEERLGVLSAEALRRNAAQLLDLAEQRLDRRLDEGTDRLNGLVTPLQQTLGKVEGSLADAERRGAATHAALTREMELVRAASQQLRDETGALVSALRRPQARGQWGEMQLRRVVEMAGMAERCDFDVQVGVRSEEGLLRPDLVVRLAGGRCIVVDAKVSLAAFLEAMECRDEGQRADRLRAHARHLRAHVDALAAKQYWARFDATPEFVVMFLPGEAFLAPALEADPALLEHAFGRRVHIMTPTTLISALRTISYEWQQSTLTAHAREIASVGRQLCQRLVTYADHVDRLGRALGTAVSAYNASVGSLERSVLGGARRLSDLDMTAEPPEPPPRVDEPVRTLAG